MLKARYTPYTLNFHFDARTSRGAMKVKDTYLIEVYDDVTPDEVLGIGECALFKGLSADDCADYEQRLAAACDNPIEALNSEYSSIRFGFEGAIAHFPVGPWQRAERGIPINGLIWMGDKRAMAQRIAEKLDIGFRVLKLKIGGINFDDELDLLHDIRRQFSPADLEIRLDANGSFSPENALCRLARLSDFNIHSIEQPIKAGQADDMARICRTSPIAIALDEELIGCRTATESEALLKHIMPQYIILKPSLCGGFSAADNYISLAGRLGIGWWATSALESNVGLMAIARWLDKYNVTMPQGLGTGMLYTNNISAPIELRGDMLWYKPQGAPINISSLPWTK